MGFAHRLKHGEGLFVPVFWYGLLYQFDQGRFVRARAGRQPQSTAGDVFGAVGKARVNSTLGEPSLDDGLECFQHRMAQVGSLRRFGLCVRAAEMIGFCPGLEGRPRFPDGVR